MKILLTGGSGFLGSALAHHLHSLGADISLLVRPTSNIERLQDIKRSLNIVSAAVDEQIETLIGNEQPDVVIHTACSYGRRGEPISQLVNANISFGLKILNSLEKVGKEVTFINTGTVLDASVSQYALTKHHFSQLGEIYARDSRGWLRFINVQLQHMYGPGDDRTKFTSYVIQACYDNEPEIHLTEGLQKRDFIYIDDVVSAYETLIRKRDNFHGFNNVELGCGVAPTVRQFVETAHRLLNSGSKLLFGSVPYRPNEAMCCQADTSLLKSMGWEPSYTLESGLKKMIQLEFNK